MGLPRLTLKSACPGFVVVVVAVVVVVLVLVVVAVVVEIAVVVEALVLVVVVVVACGRSGCGPARGVVCGSGCGCSSCRPCCGCSGGRGGRSGGSCGLRVFFSLQPPLFRDLFRQVPPNPNRGTRLAVFFSFLLLQPPLGGGEKRLL